MPMLSMVGQAKAGKDIVDGLVDSGHSVYIATFNKPSESDYRFRGEIIDINSRGTTNPFLKLFRFFDRIKALKELKRNLKIDSSISFGETANYLNVLSQQSEKSLLVVGEHKSERYSKEPTLEHKIHSFLMRLLYKRANITIGVSKYASKDLVDNFNLHQKKSITIYNPIDIEDIEKKIEESIEDSLIELFENNSVLINSGRVCKQKAQWHLIELFSNLKTTILDTKIVFLGQAEELDIDSKNIQKYIENLCNSNKIKLYSYWLDLELNSSYDVYFLGFKSNPFKYISKSKLFIFPSLWEGFGLALVEAMACKVAVVSSDCKSGPREILAPNSDFEIQTDDVEFSEYGVIAPMFDGSFENSDDRVKKIWVDSIVKLLKDDNLREEYAKKAKLRANDFSKDNILKEWIGIVE
jgi:glycosyltransferase involved in cell wall biosynthesis